MLKWILRLIKLFLGINTSNNTTTRQETARNQSDMAYIINKYGG